MPVTCTAESLATESACLKGLSPKEQAGVQTYLLAVSAGVTTNPEELAAAAACFVGISPPVQAAIQTYLLCVIANAGTGSPCGTATASILVGGGGTPSGQYNQISPIYWEQASAPDFGIRLVAGVWELFDLLTPANVWYTTTEAEFPCGTWTAVPPFGEGELTAAYI